MFYKRTKRIFDFIISLVLLLILSPLLLIISLCIWLEDRNEIFVKEPLRIGLKGKVFRMYKFRSMVPNAHQIIKASPLYDKWTKNDGKLRVKEDPRVTKVGKILRKTDLDELPQLINVLKGDMALVGPRPTYNEEINRYLRKYPEGKQYIKRIYNVRPGLTGIWQVSGRNNIKFRDRMKMEAKYASHLSWEEDIKIILKTPLVVLTRKGVYE